MDIGILGVNFKSADLSFRETLMQKTGEEILNKIDFPQVILSTCNRFEVYFSNPDLTESHSQLLHLFQREFKKDCGFRLYSYFGNDCFRHLSRVTTGLDSAILVETEIQGQVKRAYLNAQKKNLSRELHFLFQKSLKIGKSVRSQIDLGHKVVDLTDVVAHLLGNLASYYTKPKILLVGTSQINVQILNRIDKQEFDLTVCSRSLERAEQIANLYHAQVLPWSALKNWSNYDGLIFATNYPGLLIEKTNLSSPKLILDLSVPRNVPASLSDLEEIKLINIDQINKMVRRARHINDTHLSRMDHLVQEAVHRQCNIFKKKEDYWIRSAV